MQDLIIEHQKQEKDKVKRKIFKEVFDDRTEKALFSIEKRGNLDYIVGTISKGKEANLFVGKKGNNFVAVKIYRIETTNFHNRKCYIDDLDLEQVSKNPIKRIYAWTEREYFNLKYSSEKKINVPKPIDQEKNILVMQLIGEKGNPWPTLKYDKTAKKNINEIYSQFIKNMHNLIYNAKMVHSDLSEYNIIFFKNKLYIIDMGQTVGTKYHKAKEFLDRDLNNLVKFFCSKGLKVTLEQIKEDIKKLK